MRFTIFQESRVGKRRTNQDRVAYSYTRDALLLVLADGMGGHLYGEVAAQISVQFIAQSFQQEARPKVSDPVLFLSRVLSNAHHAILDYAFDKQLSDVPRTTIVACLVQEGVAHWAHAGDSRLYMIRKGKLAAQTRDHSRVQLMLDQGLLDAEAAAVHPGRNRIFSCLGGNHPPQIEFSRGVSLINGDVLAICSDGVWGPLDADTIVGTLADGRVMDAVPKLMNEAETLGGAQCDNMTLIAMTWHDDQQEDIPDTVSTRTMPADAYTTRWKASGAASATRKTSARTRSSAPSARSTPRSTSSSEPRHARAGAPPRLARSRRPAPTRCSAPAGRPQRMRWDESSCHEPPRPPDGSPSVDSRAARLSRVVSTSHACNSRSTAPKWKTASLVRIARNPFKSFATPTASMLA